jgi:hypothetical protein
LLRRNVALPWPGVVKRAMNQVLTRRARRHPQATRTRLAQGHHAGAQFSWSPTYDNKLCAWATTAVEGMAAGSAADAYFARPGDLAGGHAAVG